jgi:hypothetical protein
VGGGGVADFKEARLLNNGAKFRVLPKASQKWEILRYKNLIYRNMLLRNKYRYVYKENNNFQLS